MQLTMSGEYGVRVMLYAASLPPGKVFKMRDVSVNADVPLNFLRKIVVSLVKAGFLGSTRGRTGGLYLQIPPENISLYDIIQATDGERFLNKCLISEDQCERSSWCSVHTVWSSAQEELRKVLSSKSLKQLASENTANYQSLMSNKIHFEQ